MVIESGVLLWGSLAVLLVADVIFWVLSVGSASSEEASFPLLALAIQAVAPLLQFNVSTQFAWGAAAGLWFLGLWVYGVVFGGRAARTNG